MICYQPFCGADATIGPYCAQHHEENRARVPAPGDGTSDPTQPEATCSRCGGPNVSWCAPSPLWNEVMRGGDINAADLFSGIVCPTCFAVLAESAGIANAWRLQAQTVTRPLQTVTPSGRVWDDKAWLWVEPCAPAGAAAAPSEQHPEAWAHIAACPECREIGYPEPPESLAIGVTTVDGGAAVVRAGEMLRALRVYGYAKPATAAQPPAEPSPWAKLIGAVNALDDDESAAAQPGEREREARDGLLMAITPTNFSEAEMLARLDAYRDAVRDAALPSLGPTQVRGLRAAAPPGEENDR